ncbi:MAG TPA: bifunctional DedA family/phosphatase PAP2 family protein [Gemmatimonadales bacterium]|nr:bifunctional DedA family/phosphatase PAP2 family protein [Gemmatimonadales bacterium]
MIHHFLETYGYGALFLLVGLESVGVPLPGETALLTAAAFAAQGHLSLVGVILAAAAGGIAGDAAGYWIGRKGGVPVIRRYGRFLHIDDTKLDRARAFFERHGGKTVFLGRFVSLLRMWAAVFAGVSRMPYPKFTLFNVAGGLCWATLFGSLGYLFGRSLPQLQRAVGQAGALIALLVAIVVAIVLLGRWVESHWDEIRSWAAPFMLRLKARYPRAWTFVGQRFSRTEYLGLHLTIGMALSLGALWLFGGISEDVIHHDPLTQFDLTVADLLHRQGTPALVKLAKAITFLGSPAFIAAWGLVVCLVLLRQRRRVLLVGWVGALAGGALLDLALKLAFRRPRPVWESPYLAASGWSFPSGHAMGSLIAYGMLAYLLVLHLRSRSARLAVAAGAILLVLAIGFTRLFLGVHYFSDVMAGYAAGTVWLAVCVSGLEVLRRAGQSVTSTQPQTA